MLSGLLQKDINTLTSIFSISSFRSTVNRKISGAERRSVHILYDKYEALRIEKGVSHYRVHKETGVPESVLSEWGKAYRNGEIDARHPHISLPNLVKIANYFGVPLGYFTE